ncbi:hypothetical protein E2C01_045435 [Portunus trituberculatus]|uniref:Uncharacterized protein n=1 Tax=Portunus trituberculatus TaxID=210409 RepID=A0A5B7G176_PORTR|nr:hypothetical protein [Portunus trituberculatus]
MLRNKTDLQRLTSALSIKEGLEAGIVKYLQLTRKKSTTYMYVESLLINCGQSRTSTVYTAKAIELSKGQVYGDSTDGVTPSSVPTPPQ